MKKFTAPDGVVFETRKAMKKYIFETYYSFKNKKQEILKKDKIEGQPIDLANLEECQVTLTDHSDQIQIDECSSSKIFIAACSTSVFVRNCKNCTFFVSTKQLRVRDSFNCTFYLHSQTEPVIETSSEMLFAPFAGGYPAHGEHLKKAHLNPDLNLWWGVFDFNDPLKTQHNWRYLEDSELSQPWFPQDEQLCDQVVKKTLPGSCVLPSQLAGNGNSSGGFMSFDFTTTQQQAMQLSEKQGEIPLKPASNNLKQQPNSTLMLAPPSTNLPVENVTEAKGTSLATIELNEDKTTPKKVQQQVSENSFEVSKGEIAPPPPPGPPIILG